MANESLTQLFRQWLTQQQINMGQQHHDNEPLDIVEAFPVKGDRQLTEEYLQERVWWWRKANDQHYATIFRMEGNPTWSDILFNLYRDHLELSAYRYELLARCQSTPGYPFDVPWVRCTREQRRMLGCLWPQHWPVRNWWPGETGATWAKLDQSYNLAMNDSVLMEQFKNEITSLRERKKIERPGPGGGVRRRDLPWGAIELMDLRYFHDDALNGSQRSQVSKEKQECEGFCNESGLIL